VNGYPDGREMYVDYLRFCGFSVVGASDPSQALRWIQLLVPDVIVTDFVFPTGQLDGPGFIARVRETASGRHPRVIVISGFTQRSDEQRARDAGADRFVLKPCLPHDLLRRIDRIMMSGVARGR
jgi:DNA-binding response OmpR family regulator